MCPKHVLGAGSGTGQYQDSPNYYWADFDRTNSDKARIRLGQGFIPFWG